jgi:hypothetical protein
MTLALAPFKPSAMPCSGRVLPSPTNRTDACPYVATYIALPEEVGVCFDHAADYVNFRAVTARDVERAHCGDCKASGEDARRARQQARRSRRGDAERSRGPREAASRWCHAHEEDEP